ncbi:extracellular solute-binding protein [Ruminococcaceae bacterium OttesenSCG-928-L11]|nr:extracellular solute-binding protein [Ruminococcaceae bacterium OttesenSCG-928-L11]
MKQKAFALTTACILIASLLGACSSGGSTSSGSTAQPAASSSQVSSAAPVSSEPAPAETPESGKLTDSDVTLSVLIAEHPSFPVTRYEDSAFLQHIYDTTGIKLDLQPVPDSNDAYKNRVTTLMASGDLPDLIWSNTNDGLTNEVAVKGAFLPYTDYLDSTPVLSKLLDEHPAIAKSYSASDGKLYIMPRITQNTISEVLMIREDILEAEGLAEPATFDELYELLKTLKEKYPDMIPFINRNGGTHIINRLSTSFGTGYGGSETSTYGYYLKDGAFVYGPEEAEFKVMVEWLKKLYDEDLLDEEYALRNTAQWEEAFANENAIFAIDYVDRIRNINNDYIADGSSARVVAMKMPVGPTGAHGIKAKAALMSGSGIVINGKVKDPEAAVKFVDWLYSDTGRYAAAFGIEGVTFEIDPADGRPYYTEQMNRQANPQGKDLVADFGWIYYMDKYEFPSGYLKNTPGDPEPIDNRWEHSKNKINTNGDSIPADPVLNYSEAQSQVIKNTGVILDDYFKQNIDKFIMGTRPIAEWEDFVAELQALGVDEVKAAFNEAYAEFNSK